VTTRYVIHVDHVNHVVGPTTTQAASRSSILAKATISSM